MKLESLNYIWNNLLIIPILTVLIIGTLYIVKKKVDKNKLIEIAEKKAKRQKLVNILLSELETQEKILRTLVSDIQVIKTFNTLHADQLNQSASKSRLVYEYLDVLEEPYLKNSTIGFIDNSLLLAKEIKDLEEGQYNIKLEFQKILDEAKIHYYYKFQEDEEFIQAINSERQRVKDMLDYYSTQREHLYQRVKILLNEREVLKGNLMSYHKKHVQAKKLYIRYLAIA